MLHNIPISNKYGGLISKDGSYDQNLLTVRVNLVIFAGYSTQKCLMVLYSNNCHRPVAHAYQRSLKKKKKKISDKT